MRPPVMVLLLVVVLLATAAEVVLAPAVHLERVLPLKGVRLEHLRELDRARHARMGPLVNITLDGAFNPFGGRGISWVACKGCTYCMTNKSVLNISKELYNPDSSSTSSRISCLDNSCEAPYETGFVVCKTPFSRCGYDITYGDERRVSGYFVNDIMYFDTIMGNQLSASVVFGHLYTVNLESIAVNGQKLPIDSSLFATSNSQGTFVDSGTTLVYLVDGAYRPLVSAIFAAISPSVTTMNQTWTRTEKCFGTSSSIDSLFPTVTLYFKGGAAMTVKPSQYLLQQGNSPTGNHVVWCIAWESSQVRPSIQGVTVLGDIVLHDKIIVYDLEKQRVGWTDYNCSSLSSTSSFDVSSASPYYTGLITIGVAVVWLGAFLTG